MLSDYKTTNKTNEMKLILNYAVLIFFLFVVSCKEAPKDLETENSQELIATSYAIPQKWIENRVAIAKENLNVTEAGKIVWKSMEAHGGLDTWYANGFLSFRFDYQPLDGSTRRNTYQVIDTWNNKARHTDYADSTSSFGWDGKEAWVKAKDSTTFKYDTKFWALTPLYLAAYPFILDGEGVQLELLKQKVYKGNLQDVVKITFDANVGDAPDDYYILYFDVETHVISAIRYIVSYPEYFPNGGHSPEKIMEVTGQTVTNRILLPNGLKTYMLTENEEMGEYVTKIDIRDVAFVPQVPDQFFSKPADVKLASEK